MRCRYSIRRSARRGRSPSSSRISWSASLSIWRPLGKALARLREPTCRPGRSGPPPSGILVSTPHPLRETRESFNWPSHAGKTVTKDGLGDTAADLCRQVRHTIRYLRLLVFYEFGCLHTRRSPKGASPPLHIVIRSALHMADFLQAFHTALRLIVTLDPGLV